MKERISRKASTAMVPVLTNDPNQIDLNNDQQLIVTNEQLHQFTSHMEFCGYDIKFHEGDTLFTYPNKLTGTLVQTFPGIILRAAVTPKRKINSNKKSAVFEAINKFNAMAYVSRFYINRLGFLIVESWFYHAYDKRNFSLFLNHRISDLSRGLDDSTIVLQDHFYI